MRILALILFTVFFTQHVFASSKKPLEEIYLVVGSPRCAGQISSWYKRMTDGQEQDFTHRKTFNGLATTLDICPLKDRTENFKHICADARNYKPSANQIIGNVYLELFPGIDVNTVGMTQGKGDSEQEFKTLNLMPDVIKNLSQYMKKGATLELEHLAHFSLTAAYAYPQMSQYFKKENPFHFFVSPLLMDSYESISHQGVPNKLAFWKKAKEDIMKTIEEQVAGHGSISSGLTVEKIADQIIGEFTQEAVTVLKAMTNLASLIGISEEGIYKLLSLEIAKYKKAIRNFPNQNENLKGFEESLSCFVAQELYMIAQTPLIIDLLQKYGFEDVKISHRNNPYNGRKNVLFISAVRNGNRLPSEKR